MHSEIIPEICDKLKDGKTGCIVFDFGAYLPYDDNLVFRISLGTEELPNQKINHRYPNKNYHTISRTYGRKVSKIGYPYYFDITKNREQSMLLVVEIGNVTNIISEETVKSIFPLQLNLTKDKPVCGLSLRLNGEEMTFNFNSYNRNENGGWIPTCWSNVVDEVGIIPLNLADFNKEKAVMLFDTVIEPSACKLEELLLN